MSHDLSLLIDDERLRSFPESITRELLRLASKADGPPPERQVFANRTLRMEKIGTVGFDLDWTIADYHHEALSQLVFELTLERLIERHGYPPEIRRAELRSDFTRRGLMIDSHAGMVLKMNRHRYVGRAYHGRRFLGGGERSRHYRRERIHTRRDRFYFVDTLFELPEVNVYSELIELRTRGGLELPDDRQLFADTRGAIDSVHADGTLKEKILADLDTFLPRDPQLALALHRFALGGRRLLLITNSEWYFTDGVCTHLFGPAWRDLFDLVVVSSGKPGFFRQPGPFRELDANGEAGAEVTRPRWGEVYVGGSRAALMELLGGLGEHVLYIGDHIYGDVLSSKMTSTWRTALVVRELEEEIRIAADLVTQRRHKDVLRAELAEFGRRIDSLDDVLALYAELTPNESGDQALERARRSLAEQRGEHRALRHHVRRLQARISEAINPYWGSLFKQGSNKSLFGSQVDDFACVYTSRVSNFAYYGSKHYFRVPHDAMMHEAPF